MRVTDAGDRCWTRVELIRWASCQAPVGSPGLWLSMAARHPELGTRTRGAPHGLRTRPADRPARFRGRGPDETRGGLRLHVRVDVRLGRAVAGAVRHLQPDPRGDRA